MNKAPAEYSINELIKKAKDKGKITQYQKTPLK